jgi:hypothetical protein
MLFSQHVPVLTRCGEYWTVQFHGRTFCVRDSKGIDDLARLIDGPAEGLHVLALFQEAGARAPAKHAAGSAQVDGLSIVAGAGRWDETIDVRARAAYRARYTQLVDALAQARERNDAGHVERCHEELSQLLSELQQRSHVSCSATERARKAVYNRLHCAMRRLAQLDRELGAHLRRAIKTGISCSYRPEAVQCSSCIRAAV